MELVIIRKEYGQIIIKKKGFYLWENDKVDFNFFDFLERDIKQKDVLLEFCIIDKSFIPTVKEGQLWKATVVRTIKDKKGKEVKIMKPIELVHYHSRTCSKDIEEIKFLVVSLFYKEIIETNVKKDTEDRSDEIYEAYLNRCTLLAQCPHCNTELKEEFTKTVVRKEPTAEEALKYWLDYIGEEWNKFVKSFYNIKRKERELYYQMEDKRNKINNEIYRLKKVGITLVPFTEKERENYYDNISRDWHDFSLFGGEPEDNPPPKYYVSITNPEKYKKAQEKIEELEISKSFIEEKYKNSKKELWENFVKENKEIYEKCKFLIKNKVYPIIIEAIYSYDPYFFEFTDLNLMDPAEAVLYCLNALESYLEKLKT
jgi:sarcosine oxidase delta subunit